jgi:hypothetical protein
MSQDLMPRNPELEAAVLGAILIDPAILDTMAAVLQPSDFHDRRHFVIYRAMLGMKDTEPDVLTLTNFLEQKGKSYLDQAGGVGYIGSLAAEPPSHLRAEQYAREIAELAQKRRLLDATAKIAETAAKGSSADATAKAKRLLEGIEKRQAALSGAKPLEVLTADDILTTEWPELIWVVPGILPSGLTILGGKSKVGKSWLCLQIAAAVGAGGMALGVQVEPGPVLYLALEDIGSELQERMQAQRWPSGLPVDFITLTEFADQVGDLRNGGGERLAHQIGLKGYRLVIIDTLGRSVGGDQNDYAQMTAALDPIQKIAKAHNCGVVMSDHHHKLASADALADILGSTAKGGVSDTALGLYRERGKTEAKLSVIGRRVPEKTLALTFDGLTCSWHCEGEADAVKMTQNRLDLLDALETMKWSTCLQLAEALDRNKGSVYRDLQELIGQYVIKHGSRYALLGEEWSE